MLTQKYYNFRFQRHQSSMVYRRIFNGERTNKFPYLHETNDECLTIAKYTKIIIAKKYINKRTYFFFKHGNRTRGNYLSSALNFKSSTKHFSGSPNFDIQYLPSTLHLSKPCCFTLSNVINIETVPEVIDFQNKPAKKKLMAFDVLISRSTYYGPSFKECFGVVSISCTCNQSCV